MIDALHPDLKRQPFDFNITSRPALVKALATDGASLEHHEDRAATYVMPKEAREGVEVSGMYFWHDYPLQDDKLSLHQDWRRNMQQVNAKYTMLWKRFSETLRSDTAKTLVLSNSQHNLPQFAPDQPTFDLRFGLGRQAYEEIVEALDAYGARNYRLKFLSRSIHELADTADLQGKLDHRFVGALSLRVAPDLVTHLFSRSDGAGFDELQGSYDSGEKTIRAISDRAALIFNTANGKPYPYGSFSRGETGFIAAFEGRDQIFTVARNGSELQFSNGTRWVHAPI